MEKVTKQARAMVTVYGLNDKIGNISFYDPSQENTFTKPFSEETGKMIDDEVRKLVSEAYQRTLALLREKSPEVEKLAKELLDKEVLHKSDVEELIGKRPFEEKKLLEVVIPPVPTELPIIPIVGAETDEKNTTIS